MRPASACAFSWSACRISPKVCAAVLRSPAASAASAASRSAAASAALSPVSLAMKALTRDSGSAPMKPSTGLPSWKANTAGIDCTPICPGICGCSSIFSLTSLTAPLAARTAFSRIGVSWRQGPHQGAQKSTSTGTSREASTTSPMKSLVVVFLMSSASGVPAPPCFRIGGSTLMLLARRYAVRPRKMGCAAPFGNRSRGPLAQGKDQRFMAAFLDEADEIGRGEPRSPRVFEGVAVDLGEFHDCLIDHDSDACGRRVDEGERRDRSRTDAKDGLEPFRLAEAKAPQAEPLGERLQIDPRIVLGDDEDHAAVGIDQEQVLGMGAGNAVPQRDRLLDGEHGLVRDGRRGNAELGKAGVEGVAVCRHSFNTGRVLTDALI